MTEQSTRDRWGCIGLFALMFLWIAVLWFVILSVLDWLT